jgi:hypothetical protein
VREERGGVAREPEAGQRCRVVLGNRGRREKKGGKEGKEKGGKEKEKEKGRKRKEKEKERKMGKKKRKKGNEGRKKGKREREKKGMTRAGNIRGKVVARGRQTAERCGMGR